MHYMLGRSDKAPSQVGPGLEEAAAQRRETDPQRRLGQLRERQTEIEELLRSPEARKMDDNKLFQLVLEQKQNSDEIYAVNTQINQPERLSELMKSLRTILDAQSFGLRKGIDTATLQKLIDQKKEMVRQIEILKRYGQ